MEEESPTKKRIIKRERDGICKACHIILKVQRKGFEKFMKTDTTNSGEPGKLQRCQACNRILYDRLSAEKNNGTMHLSNGSQETFQGFDLDCYPYTFSPLLLFASSAYFDKGYSNYNSVASFFAPILDVNMLEHVLFEGKNMLYEELINTLINQRYLVTCCIEAHFTAFQIISDKALIYYDPLSPSLALITGDSFITFIAFMLLKCSYGDNPHLQENKNHYTGAESNPTRRKIYAIWQKVHNLELRNLGLKSSNISMDLNRYYLINGVHSPSQMSTQLTGNTCYFQTYLFALLCKICKPSLANSCVEMHNIDKLEEATVKISRFMLEFFVQKEQNVMRPLSNSNVVIDFYRYRGTEYYSAMIKYLQHVNVVIPDYEMQYYQLLRYYLSTKTLHKYGKFTLTGPMSSTPNTKSLQAVCGTDDAVYKLARSNYFKYRPTNLMFGFNAGIMHNISSFAEFNSLRKNQLLGFQELLQPLLCQCRSLLNTVTSKYRDYYFMPQFEVGQIELVDAHYYTYLIDIISLLQNEKGPAQDIVRQVNAFLAEKIYFSTQKSSTYEKMMSTADFLSSKNYVSFFLMHFMSVEFMKAFVGLGFAEINPKEKEINALTQTVFYSTQLMGTQAYRMEYDFEKECINQMARSTLRKYLFRFEGGHNLKQNYHVSIKIGYGFTYSKYNTLMHFLNVVECYWQNSDLNNIQVLGKDIRTLLTICCQKIFFEEGHTYYHYGPVEVASYNSEIDLAVANSLGNMIPGVSRDRRGSTNQLILTDRVYEYNYLRAILKGMFQRVGRARIKTDNAVINLNLLSLILDFNLYEEYIELLNIPFMQRLTNLRDKRQLQVEVANTIHEFDRKNTSDSVTRLKIEELIFEVSYKFLVNKRFPTHSPQNVIIQELSADPAYHQQLLLCKINMSLCQINKSMEVDYYKVRCNGKFRTIIPQNFSKMTGEYLEEITRRYTFSEHGGVIYYDDLPLFDLRSPQPEVNLFKVRLDSATAVSSMVKYIEIKNAFRVNDVAVSLDQYLLFIADNALFVEVPETRSTRTDGSFTDVVIRINKIAVEVAMIFFNVSISFVPCFKYVDSEDVILFSSPNIHYMVDQGGQFCTDYYGMRHELIECIHSEEVFVDLNDEHVFKKFKLSDLLTESKTVFYFPDYLLQVPNRQHLINLLDLAIRLRNISFFILVLFYLRRSSVALDYIEREGKVVKISGPWKEAILYVLNKVQNQHYDSIFEQQFFDLSIHEHLPLTDFIDVLCENFTRYQRVTDDGQCQIVPTAKQKAFLRRIITAEECFHFSEVGSGKTKVILPLLCQAFLSNHAETHFHLSRGGKAKDVLVILVPEHLVQDARTQVYRYCLNLNFREEYRVYDDIFALLHAHITLSSSQSSMYMTKVPRRQMKQIFVTSFNQFKKALTYDVICQKVWPHREHILVVADEVDDFLDRDKLVFNICSNKGNAFDKPTLELYFEISQAAYKGEACPVKLLDGAVNPVYWQQLHAKFEAIHLEIQDASRSVNKSFGIFNEQSLRHCSTNIAHDIEGYKSLIARPYESVNRAMPGSYYSDVERTVYLTYVILSEDTSKYDELFQQERKFISFEYWRQFVGHLDYDDLVYGLDPLSDIVQKHPETKDGLLRFLYEIILRRMEIRDKSKSVNSIDIVFNFDCIGFTGTPFIDNYPTFAYIRNRREDEIPSLIDRSFYAYTCDNLSNSEFEDRFARFQGHNSNVLIEYVNSDFIKAASAIDEMAILEQIFSREEQVSKTGLDGGSMSCGFNVLVDLCGIFKRSSIYDVRNLVFSYFGPERFHYVYHINQTDGSDRVLRVNSDTDVQFDEEFFKFLCKTYGPHLRDKVFFFVDNRNVIGKDIPFQLIYHGQFGQALFKKSVVVAHDVDDFSKIWQAMGRSRTMNDTKFAIYKCGVLDEDTGDHSLCDIKQVDLTRQLYILNCDRKMAGNLSSIYQTLISLLNLSKKQFYYCDEIVNSFLDKMMLTIAGKVSRHQEQLAHFVLGSSLSAGILAHILADKCHRSSVPAVYSTDLTANVVHRLLCHIVQQKFEQREMSNDVYDDFIRLLSGEQQSLMEISYTKQQQKQKQKQTNKNQDSDTMDVFDKSNQLEIAIDTDNYFNYTLTPHADVPRVALSLPISEPILSLTYALNGVKHSVRVYPTVQFLYSHHIMAAYISREVRTILREFTGNGKAFSDGFFRTIDALRPSEPAIISNVAASLNVGERIVLQGFNDDKMNGLRGRIVAQGSKEGRWKVLLSGEKEPISVNCINLRSVSGNDGSDVLRELSINVLLNFIRQNPQYSLAAVEKGVYVIGMKDQFNIYDLQSNPFADRIDYIADDMGYILHDRNKSDKSRGINVFGPYFIEQYILMEILSKHEVAQNVLDYYVNHRDKLERGLRGYTEAQGQGFVCWRFLIHQEEGEKRAEKRCAVEDGCGMIELGVDDRT